MSKIQESSQFKKALELYDLKELERLGFSPDLEQRKQILVFMAMVLKWNAAAGLISPKDEANMFIRHFCDSLYPHLLFGFKKNAAILDIGSGGGFPAFPIHFFRPDCSIVLAESNKKKASFLSEVKNELQLEKVEVFANRIEKLDTSRKFDYVISRGLATIPVFVDLAKDYLTPDGRMYTFKSKNFHQELEEITTGKEKMGVKISEIAEYDLGNQILGLNLVALELMK